MGDEAARTSTLEGLANLAPHLRSRIGKALRLRAAPEVEFRIDDSIARAARIDSLLAQARESDAARPRTVTTASSGLVLIDKPAGLTSQQAVVRVRKALVPSAPVIQEHWIHSPPVS